MAKMKWYRVILDEAQFVRNRNTRSSKTVAMLKAKYRWMLTGTPITNSLYVFIGDSGTVVNLTSMIVRRCQGGSVWAYSVWEV